MPKKPLILSLPPILTAIMILVACASKPVTCVPIDGSQSARFALVYYQERLRALLGDVASDGGTIRAMVAVGDPSVEANPRTADFSDLTGVERESDRQAAIDGFITDLQTDLQAAAAGTQNPTPGSGIVKAINVLADAGRCDQVVALADGLENSSFRVSEEPIETEAGRASVIDRLDARGEIPDLEGAELSFPFGGFLPQGTTLDDRKLRALPLIWDDFADAAGAGFSWRTAP